MQGKRYCVSCRKSVFLIVLLVIAASLASPAGAEAPYDVSWKRQWGTLNYDYNDGMATDPSGNIFISGSISGGPGSPNYELYDAFVIKYDNSGNLLWTRQIDASKDDRCLGVATDTVGDVVICGSTNGSLDGPYAGYVDCFVRKYDTSGNIIWTRQLGTAMTEYASGVATDSGGNIFITGYTTGSLGGPYIGNWDAFVAKYDTAGNLLWTRHLGTPNDDVGNAVAIDMGGNVLVSGTTKGSLGGTNIGYNDDAFVRKYDTYGNVLWTRQLGTPKYDRCYSVAADATDNVFIVGETNANLGGGGPTVGSWDVFLAKYDALGNIVWTRQLGTSREEYGRDVAIDPDGNIYISGQTNGGSLGGPAAGSWDAFVSKYDGSGNNLWTRQLGTSYSDSNNSVVTDAAGNVFISGITYGKLGASKVGLCDVYLAKYAVPPLEVVIDVKPGSDPSSVNPNAKGVLPVVIFGGEDFSVYDIDLASLELSGAAPRSKGNSSKIGIFGDVNGDGIIDLLLHFEMDELVIDPFASELVLEGLLNNGRALTGSDLIRIVPPGDVDGDGAVGGADLSVIINNWGLADGSYEQGDLTGDGLIGAADYQAVLTNWGTTAASQLAPAGIPEPATLGLVIAGAWAVLRRRL